MLAIRVISISLLSPAGADVSWLDIHLTIHTLISMMHSYSRCISAIRATHLETGCTDCHTLPIVIGLHNRMPLSQRISALLAILPWWLMSAVSFLSALLYSCLFTDKYTMIVLFPGKISSVIMYVHTKIPQCDGFNLFWDLAWSSTVAQVGSIVHFVGVVCTRPASLYAVAAQHWQP